MLNHSRYSLTMGGSERFGARRACSLQRVAARQTKSRFIHRAFRRALPRIPVSSVLGAHWALLGDDGRWPIEDLNLPVFASLSTILEG